MLFFLFRRSSLSYFLPFLPSCLPVSLTIIQLWHKLSFSLLKVLNSYVYSQCEGKGKAIPLQAGVAQRVGIGIALLFHDRDTRRR